jgi:hypothetical protein
VTKFLPNGQKAISQIIFSRLSGSDGFAGQWRDTSYLQQHADMTLRLDKQVLHIDYPSASQDVDAPLDEAEAAVRGPHVLEGTTLTVRPAGNRELLIVTKLQGKVFTQSSLKLSNDGRTITGSSWSPDRPGDKSTLIYERQ